MNLRPLPLRRPHWQMWRLSLRQHWQRLRQIRLRLLRRRYSQQPAHLCQNWQHLPLALRLSCRLHLRRPLRLVLLQRRLTLRRWQPCRLS